MKNRKWGLINLQVERVQINPDFYRPNEVDLLIGDATKANTLLGWLPKTTLEELCEMMVNEDIQRNEKAIKGGITAGVSF